MPRLLALAKSLSAKRRGAIPESQRDGHADRFLFPQFLAEFPP
jgi:hypothetical protein